MYSNTIQKVSADISNGNATQIAKAILKIAEIRRDIPQGNLRGKQTLDKLILLDLKAKDALMLKANAADVAQQLLALNTDSKNWMQQIINSKYNTESYSHAKEQYRYLQEVIRLIELYIIK